VTVTLHQCRGNRLVDACGVFFDEPIRIVAPARDRRAVRRIAQQRKTHVVELDVGRARRRQRCDLLPIRGDDVVPEIRGVLVVTALAHAFVAAGEHVQRHRRRDRHLRHARGVGLEEGERAHDRAGAPADRARDPQPRRRLLRAAGVAPGHLGGAGAVGGKPVPVHDQLEPPAAPAELAVRHRLEADALLHGDRRADAVVLDRAQFAIVVRAEVAVGGLRAEQALARELELLRPQQAADLVGPERRARRGARGFERKSHAGEPTARQIRQPPARRGAGG